MNTSVPTNFAVARRIDIQLLRGVAVLGVMLAHFGALVPGGFLGVDVFFVISGFVITLSMWSLRDKHPSHRAFLAEFWKRRFFRLVPVLVVVLTATLIGAAVTLAPRGFADQVEMSVWSLFFAGNIGVEVVTRGDYFDPGVEENWLLHLWSLGVEEQFYLLFPLIFLAAIASPWARARAKRSTLVVSALLVTSFAFALLNDWDDQLGWGGIFTESTGLSAAFGYYSPLTRAWQFLFGVLAALFVPQSGTKKSQSISLGSLAVLLGSFALVPESNLLPGWPTVFPMVAVTGLLIFPLSKSLVQSPALRPLRWLGDRSYSAYLWHWPVWLFVTSRLGDGVISIGLSFAVTIGFSALSFRFIEQPFMKRHRGIQPVNAHSPQSAKESAGENPADGDPPSAVPSGGQSSSSKRAGTGALVALIALPLVVGGGTLGIYGVFQETGVLRSAPPVPQLEESRDCMKTSCDDTAIDVLLVGDSHAGSVGDALTEALEVEGVEMYGAVVARTFGCLHLPSTTVTSVHEECQELSQQVRSLVQEKTPRVVIIHGYTAGRFTTVNSGGDSEIQLIDQGSGIAVNESTAVDAYRSALQDTLDIFGASGAQIIVVSGVPDFAFRPEEVGRAGKPASQAELLFAPWFDFEFGDTVSKQDYLARHGEFIAVEQDLAQNRDFVHLIEPWEFLCEEQSCSQSTPGGDYLYSDQDHVSELGATQLARGIVDNMASTGLLDLARSAR
ncbi:peptidoglycan acetyltransferase/SGNH-hydrolase [Pontimonas salivibrio]|uniref:Peptidoglycan acetyltransferase/SGNH-hydrolase n=1 Tax=Pontimonas salivibrio TaxID=1159327 RepID=A0A2L2BSN5_9MICO|nr:acyltransferase family protein [Pontimonas salivibrio]AVG24647.1 peptidoglycan acetyltransferase/SGNH-hydrolase [Pontimonas salivibrio]